MMISAIAVSHVHISYMICFFSTVGVGMLSEKNIDKKKDKTRIEYKNVKNQLDDIISIDFEKKRYALEKNYSNTPNKNDLLKNIQAEKELLEKYKNDLNQYCIHDIDEELINEINSHNYALCKINQIK